MTLPEPNQDQDTTRFTMSVDTLAIVLTPPLAPKLLICWRFPVGTTQQQADEIFLALHGKEPLPEGSKPDPHYMELAQKLLDHEVVFTSSTFMRGEGIPPTTQEDADNAMASVHLQFLQGVDHNPAVEEMCR